MSTPYEDKSSLEEEQDFLLPETKEKVKNRRSLAVLWLISLFVTAVAAYTLARLQVHDRYGTFASGYLTDFDDARTAVGVVTKTFTGAPRFGHDGHEYIPPNSPSLKYMGATPEVDAAWSELSEDRYFLLTDEEAQAAWGDNYKEYWAEMWGGYLGGLDMFHTIHCLDHIRMAFHPDVYHLDALHGQMHQEHCVEHLRQMVMCNADLTIIPSRFYEGINQNYIDSDRPHTCRNFSQIRQWTTSRVKGPAAVPARNRDGTPRE